MSVSTVPAPFAGIVLAERNTIPVVKLCDGIFVKGYCCLLSYFFGKRMYLLHLTRYRICIFSIQNTKSHNI
ncbi:hypothetical protein PAXRUDRAFT_502978 [Paxillus rubicundulus Ve08.2h10]|uniref:Uncharacterized protein n=1 Tax=Paxillus rubicundulus Ve08.2h10 TaxID=930991 RepID=A0A0D0D9C0_9AGAM|nr:hypothetical protein PAXRUDRAFT_502978 [Paxillus rubicundulus Ve08.2h10]